MTRPKRIFHLASVIFAAIILIAMIFSTAGCTQESAEVKTLEIGYVDGYTGIMSDLTMDHVRGAWLARDLLNEEGGITVDGEKYQIKLIEEDSKNTAEGAVSATTRLITEHNVKFVAGTGTTYLVKSVASVTEPAHVIYGLNWILGAPDEFDSKSQYSFGTGVSFFQTFRMNLDWLAAEYPEVKTLCYLGADDADLSTMYPQFKQASEERGFTCIGDIIPFAVDTVDFSPIAREAISRNADAWVMAPGWESWGAAVAKVARPAGFDGPFAITCQGDMHNLLAILGTDDPAIATDIFFTGLYLTKVEDVANIPDIDKYPLLKKAAERSLTEYGYVNTSVLQTGFNSVWCIAHAVEKAQSFDPDVVKEKWENFDTIESAEGIVPMGGKETYGVRHMVEHWLMLCSLNDGVVKHEGWMQISIP
jgi:ABC-type branched-subunit amino acid transport system substrate-binding protein